MGGSLQSDSLKLNADPAVKSISAKVTADVTPEQTRVASKHHVTKEVILTSPKPENLQTPPVTLVTHSELRLKSDFIVALQDSREPTQRAGDRG